MFNKTLAGHPALTTFARPGASDNLPRHMPRTGDFSNLGRCSMVNEQKYNGWTNYETWNVALWIDNDQGTQEMWAERAEECWHNAGQNVGGTFTRDEQATLDLASMLENELDTDMHETMGVPELTGFYADLLNAALSEVNWHEIAEHMIEEVDKEIEAS